MNPVNPLDHPVTIFRKHNLIAGENILIFGMSGRDNEESVNPFMKSKMIAGNPRSIFAKIKNTFGKNKNYIHVLKNDFRILENIFFVPKNQFTGRNLQGAGKKLKFYGKRLKFMEKV